MELMETKKLDMIFQNKLFNMQQIMGRTQDRNIIYHIHDTNIFVVKSSSEDGSNQHSRERNEAWKLPPHNMLKVNVDAL